MHRRVEDGSGSGGGGKEKRKKMEEVRTRPRCLVFVGFLNVPKEDGDDNNDDNGVSHHGSETEGRPLFIINQVCDHKKCIESQQRSGINSSDLNLVLPGHEHGHGPDSVCTAEHQESKQAEIDPHNPCCDPEQVELPEAGFSSTDQTPPPCSSSDSDSDSDSSLSTPFALEYKDVDFKLKAEDS